MNIGNKIKDARIRKKMTQEELANRSGLAVITISQYERGKRQPRIEQLAKIASALQIPLTYFMESGEQQRYQAAVYAAEKYLTQEELKSNPNFLSKFVTSNSGFMSLLSALGVTIEIENTGRMYLSYDGNSTECSAQELSYMRDSTISHLRDWLNKEFFLGLPDTEDTNED